MRIVQLLVFVLLAGCADKKSEVAQNSQIDCEDNGYVNVQEWRKEVLDIDSVKHNGDSFLLNSLSYYRNIFGKETDSYDIADEDVAIFGDKGESKTRYIFNGAIVDQVGDKAIINTLDFSTLDLELHAFGLVLKNGAKVIDVCELYPRSCRLIPSNGNQWSGFIELKVHNSGLDFRRLFLIYQKEKLKKIKIANFGF